jgi:hypothetical protein
MFLTVDPGSRMEKIRIRNTGSKAGISHFGSCIYFRSYYHLMREERQPLWEDPMICNGGTWRLKCMKKDTVREAGIIEF